MHNFSAFVLIGFKRLATSPNNFEDLLARFLFFNFSNIVSIIKSTTAKTIIQITTTKPSTEKRARKK